MLDYAIKNKLHMLIVGNTGTGKTVLAQQSLEGLSSETECKLVLNFSAATSSLTTQVRGCVRADYCTNFGYCDNSVREKDWRYRKRGTQAT
jgi:Cdc6-like AAA superfamily ATPase